MMALLVIVHNMGAGTSQSELLRLKEMIQQTIGDIPALGISGHEVEVDFPINHLSSDEPENVSIFVRVVGIFNKPGRSSSVFGDLAKSMAQTIVRHAESVPRNFTARLARLEGNQPPDSIPRVKVLVSPFPQDRGEYCEIGK